MRRDRSAGDMLATTIGQQLQCAVRRTNARKWSMVAPMNARSVPHTALTIRLSPSTVSMGRVTSKEKRIRCTRHRCFEIDRGRSR